jgi:regulator of sigma E protease
LDQPNDPARRDSLKPADNEPGAPGPLPPTDASAGPAPAAASGPGGEAGAAPAPPLTFSGWLAGNVPYLLPLVLLGVWLYVEEGVGGLLRGGIVVLGLGFVIFIHELGHFLTAKWCDVHVQTFSIGFGPALPGCSFQRGETTYKLAVLPLGGYVAMVGEGPEADEDEDYPRSFKNKTVGQRMLIISAGVFMNVLFGCIVFVGVYRYRGVDQQVAVVEQVDAGSPAWEQGVRSGWAVTKIGDKPAPFFKDLKMRVVLSPGGRAVPFTFEAPDGQEVTKEIEPRRDLNSTTPAIGVAPATKLTLWPPEAAKFRKRPVIDGSAAAAARALPLQDGDVLVEATDPSGDDGNLTALPRGEKGWQELGKRLRRLDGRDLVLKVRRKGAGTDELQTVTAPPSGFDFGDTIVATTDPATPDEPFHVTPLPLDKDRQPDPLVYHRRMVLLAGKPVVLQVRRHGPGEVLASLLVPAAFHLDYGMRMKMGEIAAVRAGSDAEQAGVAKGQVITGAKVRYGKEESATLRGDELDPVRLPDALARRIYRDPKKDATKWSVVLTVKGAPTGPQDKERTLRPIRWDDSWRFDREPALNPASPLAIPELGIAYAVTSTVVSVKKDSPAEAAGILPNDEVRELRLRKRAKKPGEVSWTRWVTIESRRGQDAHVFDQWACYFHRLNDDVESPIIEVKVYRNGALLETPLALEPTTDESWPLVSRGVLLSPDTRLRKASNIVEALGIGVYETIDFIQNIYLTLRGVISGRVSTGNLGGPIEIASQAFAAAEDPGRFFLFLAFISINLAVVNFLPIPVLDGGHMVFLIYEKLRGRPPSEAVRNVATYVGLAMIACLMLFVFYVDIKRRFFGM